MFRFQCSRCSEWHEGMPSFGAAAPLFYYGIPEAERGRRCALTADTCIVDDAHFFVRGCIEIPVRDADEPFSWGVWASLSRDHFARFVELLDCAERSQHGPWFGWLSAAIKTYPDTENLKTLVHLRDHGVRPYIELEPTDHPLAIEQRQGISVARLADIYAACTH